MKIFNWVHRRFNHKDGSLQKNSCGINYNGYENGGMDIINHDHHDEEEFMLVNNTSIGDIVFDHHGWKGGILAIGTFGYKPLTKDIDEPFNDDYYFPAHQIDQLESENNNKKEGSTLTMEFHQEMTDSEVNPLVYAVYAHDYNYDYEGGLLMDENNHVHVHEEEEEFEFDHEFDEMMKIKEKKHQHQRTTLAELFSADSQRPNSTSNNNNTNKQEILLVKDKETIHNVNHKQQQHGGGFVSFPKKLIGGDSTHPVHKLHRLMRKMLKRKIHPELGLNKDDIDNINNPKVIRGSPE